MNNKSWFLKGLRDGIPISLGYFAVAFTLGITAKNAGFTALQAAISSILNHASAGEYAGFTLISAGDNWYETLGECEVILDGTPEIDFWLQPPNSREAKIEKLELADLPERPNKTSRLRITAKPLSDAKVQIQIKDLGFGELFKGSDKVWEYIMSFEEESIWEN